MMSKTKRRALLRHAATAALAGAIGITSGSAQVDRNSEPLQVTVPERLKAGEPFTLQVSVPKLKFTEDETRWVEVWLGREYLGRFEVANPTTNASLTLTLTLTHSTTLRVRDFYGRTIAKKLLVV